MEMATRACARTSSISAVSSAIVATGSTHCGYHLTGWPSLTSAIARLPDDVLSDTLCLAAGSNLSSKLAIAQVSPRWRHVALNSPLLWTRIRVSTVSDCALLPLVLERCGSSALLDIMVCGGEHSFRDSENFTSLESAMWSLHPYATRIRTIITDWPTDALLNVQLTFPALRMLRVRAVKATGSWGNTYISTCIRLTAPNLRVLELFQVAPLPLEDMLCAQLERISIDNCTTVRTADLLSLLARCINVVHLTLRMSGDWEPVGRDALRRMHPLRHIQTLDLRLRPLLTLDILEHAVHADAFLPAIAVHFYWDYCRDEENTLILNALLRRMGPITQFSVEDQDYVTILDDAGHLRKIGALCEFYYNWNPVWKRLAMACRAQETIREITMPLTFWDALSKDLAAYPAEAVSRLRVLFSPRDNNYDASPDNLPVLPQLAFPRLRRVEFGSVQPYTRRLPSCLIVCVLRAVTWDRGRKLDVEIDAHVAEVEQTRDLMQGDERCNLLN